VAFGQVHVQAITVGQLRQLARTQAAVFLPSIHTGSDFGTRDGIRPFETPNGRKVCRRRYMIRPALSATTAPGDRWPRADFSFAGGGWGPRS
jgi:hypothetical protein